MPLLVASKRCQYLDSVLDCTKTQCLALVGVRGQRVKVPFLLAVAVCPVLTDALVDSCTNCDGDVVVDLPGFSTEAIEMLVDFIMGETIFGNYKELIELDKLIKALGIKVDISINGTDFTQTVACTADGYPQQSKLVANKESELVKDTLRGATALEVPRVVYSIEKSGNEHQFGRATIRSQLNFNDTGHSSTSTSENVTLVRSSTFRFKNLVENILESYEKRTCLSVPHTVECERSNTSLELPSVQDDTQIYDVPDIQETTNVQEHGTSQTEEINEIQGYDDCEFVDNTMQTPNVDKFVDNATQTHDFGEFVDTATQTHDVGEFEDSMSQTHNADECEDSKTQVQVFDDIKTDETKPQGYICKNCGKSFVKRLQWLAHVREHEGKKPFKCRYCKAVFLSASGCRDHEFKHFSEVSYKCKYCGKSYKSNHQCSRNKFANTSRKPYSCKYCDKSFYRNDCLKRHMQTHVQKQK